MREPPDVGQATFKQFALFALGSDHVELRQCEVLAALLDGGHRIPHIRSIQHIVRAVFHEPIPTVLLQHVGRKQMELHTHWFVLDRHHVEAELAGDGHVPFALGADEDDAAHALLLKLLQHAHQGLARNAEWNWPAVRWQVNSDVVVLLCHAISMQE